MAGELEQEEKGKFNIPPQLKSQATLGFFPLKSKIITVKSEISSEYQQNFT